MAYKGQEKTISSVSDILGFILEQSDLPPEKRTPVRPPETSELQAESEYVSTLVDALALPGTFVGDETLKTIQSLVDPETKIKSYQDRIGNVKIKASAIPSFLENPDEFVDKLFEDRKQLAKMQRIQWAGERMKMLAGSSYAKKTDMFTGYDSGTKTILERAVGQVAMESSQAPDRMWATQASDKIMKNGYLGRKYQALRNKLEDGEIHSHEKMRIEREIKEIESIYNQSLNAGEKDMMKRFRSLLDKEFGAHRDALLGERNLEDLSEEEAEEYYHAQEAQNMVGLWNEYDETKKKRKVLGQINERKDSLQNQKSAIEKGDTILINGRKIDFSLLSDDEKKKHLSAIKREMKTLNSANRTFQRMNFWSSLGRVEGAYYGIKQTLGPGGLEAVLNRDFYDPNKGYFGCPSYEDKFSYGGVSIDFMRANNKEVGKLGQAYNDAMMEVYYYNPANMIRTLVTGERFAWKANQMEEQLKNMWSVSAGDFVHLKDPKFWGFYKKFKNLDATGQAELLALDEYQNYAKLMSRLGKVLGDKDSNLAKKFLKAEKLHNKFEKFANRARIFSAPTRLVKSFSDKTVGAVQKKMRDSIVGFLSKLKMFSSNEGAKSLLKAWGAGAGGKALSAAISSAITGALGIAGTALGGPVGTAITIAVSAALEKITKISIKVFIYGFIGIFALFMLLPGILGTSKKKSRIDAYSREIPGTIYYNEFESYGGSYFGDDDNGGGEDDGPEIIPPVTDEECILGTGYKRCTQGWGGEPCFSHSSILGLKPVDLAPVTFIHAPQFCDSPSAECVIQNSAPFYCKGGVPGGSQVWFSAFDGKTTYKFHFVHTILVNGYSPGSKVPAGETFAYVQQSLTKNSCWTGAHLHMEVQQNGAYVDPLALLQAFNCDVPSLSGCTNCVGGE